ncbi:DUF885 domain-containing protein [Niveispirillum sp. KHB5.9]|uniref:DUF885 domain-containing protein n=1 Tax=Niveispirillum sp. KHB5.9 TaxID=3400269 RepID=UPI003A87835B
MISRRHLLALGGTTAALALLPTLALAAEGPGDKALYAFFAELFERDVAESPLRAMQLGRKTGYDQLDDASEARAVAELEQAKADLARLTREFPEDKLSDTARLYARLFRERAEDRIEDFPWRHHQYILTLVSGPHTNLPVQLINQHKVESKQDAEAYISRLRQFPRYFGQVEERLRLADEAGVLPPRYFFPDLISVSRNQIKGRPVEPQADAEAPLFADLRTKIEKLEIPADEKAALVEKAAAAMREGVAPAYLSLIKWLQGAAPRANPDHGAWRLPRGQEFYASCLKRWTSLPLSADYIHKTGMDEVKRIHGEIKSIMDKVEFKGSLTDFFNYTRDDDRFYFPDSEEGRADYLKQATAYVDAIKAKLDLVFNLQPKAPMEVRAVEKFREKSTSSAFYNGPSPDGKRPGIYYVNLSNMRARPRFGLETLSYHEGIPGHHMQVAIAQELDGVPDFQKFGGGYSAFGEGWALYTEFLAKEMGFFQDPYSDYGRLVAELWRAVRLVVDSGIHAKRWDRQKAIDFFVENTPMDPGGAAREIDRYIGWPGQATSYKIGMLKILELREAAKKRMGARFDIRGFHDTVLKNGRLPMPILQEQVEAWSKA